MSTLSIVAITVIAALFSLLLLSSIAALIYAHILLRRQIAGFSLTVNESRIKLDSQFAHIEALIGTIHGDQIQKAAQEFLQQIPRQAQIATRLETATLLFIDAIKSIGGEFEISGSAVQRAAASGLGPEDYAPAAPDERFVTKSRTAQGDALALAEESALNSQSFDDDQG